ncbi:MAG: peroxiredoxin [Pseudomonadota bacterium]
MLKKGQTAPDFELSNQDDTTLSLDGLLQEGDLLLYFYPADFTPVCTAEACVFRDNYAGIAELGKQIVGISPQSVNSHARFAEQYELPFPILSDVAKKVIRAYGVDGPLGFGVRRVTFLIGQDKVVKKRVIADFTTASHLALLKETIAEG